MFLEATLTQVTTFKVKSNLDQTLARFKCTEIPSIKYNDEPYDRSDQLPELAVMIVKRRIVNNSRSKLSHFNSPRICRYTRLISRTRKITDTDDKRGSESNLTLRP